MRVRSTRYMVEVKDSSPVASLQTVCILHYVAIRKRSTTSHLRVVFNASSKTGSSKSLNDRLLIGPNLQTDLAAVILRCHRCRYFIAHIAKIYRQTFVDFKDVDYQWILWRSSPSKPLPHYRLLTVTHDTACALYLAVRILQELAKDESRNIL